MLQIRYLGLLGVVAIALLLVRDADAISGNIMFRATEDCDDPSGCVVVGSGDPIRLAYALVVSGPNRVLGVDSRRGIEIAINDENEVLGHTIELVGEDARCSVEGGQSAATKLASDPILIGVIGTSCSIAGAPASAILSEAGMVLISPSNSAPPLTAPDTHRSGYLRTSFNDKVQGKAMAEFAYNELGVRRAATIHDGSPYAKALQKVFVDVFTELGGVVVAEEAINVGDIDMRPILARIAIRHPDFLYYPVFIAEGGFITNQVKDVSGLENTILAGSDGIFSPDFLYAAGDAAEGMYVTRVNMNWSGRKYNAFLAKYQKLYDEPPIAPFHAQAYDATTMILRAIEQAGISDEVGNLVIGRQSLRNVLFETHLFDGITGILSCDQYGDCADPLVTIYQVSNTEFEAIYDLPIYLRAKNYLPLMR